MNKLVSISWWRNVFQRTSTSFGLGCAVVMGISMVGFFGWNFSGRNPQGGPTDLGKTIATVNGQPITQSEYGYFTRQLTSERGEQYAQTQGAILAQLVRQSLLAQEAKRRGVHASDADIDKQLQQERETRLGKSATDSQWEDYVDQMYHMTLADYRELIGWLLVGPALLENYKNAEKVTVEEAQNQSAEVNLEVVLIPTLNPTFKTPPPKNGPKPLPDAEALKKAQDLLAQAKSGTDIKAIARANSADFTAKQGGEMGWRPEFKSGGMPAVFGVLGYGKDFDDAIHKTPKRQFTDVVKVTGFQTGYAFARVVDRRNNLPKDFVQTKAVDQMKQERASQKLQDYIQKAMKSAKVVFANGQEDLQAFYDYFRVKQMPQEMMMAQFGGGDPSAAPTQADVDKLQARVDSEFEEMLKRYPDDSTAALIVANNLKKKLNDLKTPPAERAQIRDRLISLYEIALKDTEDRAIRFELADLYREKQQYKQAEQQYNEIDSFIDTQPPDSTATQQAIEVRRQLETRYKGIESPETPEAAAAATKEEALVKDLQTKLAEQKKQEAAASKANQPSLPPGALAPSGAGGGPTGTAPGAQGAAPASQGKPAATSQPGAAAPASSGTSHPAASTPPPGPTTAPTSGSSKPTAPPAPAPGSQPTNSKPATPGR